MGLKVGDTWPRGHGMVGGLLLNEHRRIWYSGECFQIQHKAGECGSDNKPVINILDMLNGVWI